MRKIGKFHILTLWMIPLFCLSGLFICGAAQQDEGKTEKETGLINVDVLVRDVDGNRVLDLKKEDFEIYEDGALQEISRFGPTSHPLRLILLFDQSISMGGAFSAMKEETVKMVESLNQLDEIMVGAFDTSLQWRSEWGGKGLATAEILALRSLSAPALESSDPQPAPSPRPRFPTPFPVPPGGRVPSGRRMVVDKETNLFGAMRSLFVRVGARSKNEVVVLISDGKDSLDKNLAKGRPVKDSKQAIRETQGSLAQIYCACFKAESQNSGMGFPFPTGGSGSDCKFLSEIANTSGGRSFEFESQSALAQVLKKTLDELKDQYSIGYFPSAQGNKPGFHKIKVVVKKPNMTARARDGYLISK